MADDQVGTTAFRLRRVDPDFLFKSQLPRTPTCTLPPHQGGKPATPPGAAPYLLATTSPATNSAE